MDDNATWEGYQSQAAEQGGHAAMEPDDPPPKTYRLLSVDDPAAMPPQRYRIKQVLPETGFAAIFGPSGSGKSFLALDIAAAIAGRADWFGFRIRTGPVIYLCLEGEGGLRARIAAHRTEHGGDSLSGVRFVLESFHILGDPPALVRAVKAAGMATPVIIIDTLNRAAPGLDENSSVDMGKIIAACKALEAETGGLIILIHHTGKDGTKGLRGHSCLVAALDAAIKVDRDGDRRTWAIEKSKDGADGESFDFDLKVIELGKDEDGDPITSCVVACGDQPFKQHRQPLGRNAKKAFDVLVDLIEQYRCNLAESGKNPDDANVSYNDWCKGLRDMEKTAASKARTEVVSKGYATKNGCYVRAADEVAAVVNRLPLQPSNQGDLGCKGCSPPLGGATMQPTSQPEASTYQDPFHGSNPGPARDLRGQWTKPAFHVRADVEVF